MSSPRTPRVALVGAGFCGVALAHRLARAARPPELVLIERRGEHGPGMAYRTADPRHLLNTPAARMSALADDPDHFTRWARARDPAVHGGSFLPRGLYGAYLRDLLDAARAAAPITCISDQVVAATPDEQGLALHLAGAAPLRADALVLALGNLAPRHPPGLPAALRDHPRYCHDPWDTPPRPVDADAAVLIFGTGLSALDLALGLHGAGHRGPLHLLSRHGLVSHAHRTPARPPTGEPLAVEAWAPTVRDALRQLRAALARARDLGLDWREVITALRPATPAIWRAWPEHERERFLRHLRALWDVHRHRAAPDTAAAIAAMQASGQLRVHAGRIDDMSAEPDALALRYRPRGAEHRASLRASLVINATGPASDPRDADDPLLRGLIARGDLVPHPLGARTDEDGALLDRSGAASARIFTLGALRRPDLWETTAVLELAPQAAALAELLLDRLRG